MAGIFLFAFRFAILTSLLFTPGNAMTGQCMAASSSVFCRGMEGRFLSRGHKPKVIAFYILDSDLRALTAKDFAAFHNLESLHILKCSIPIIPVRDILRELGHLKTLQIMHSNIDLELGKIIGDVPGLTRLSLPGNNISRIDKTLVGHFHHVETIDLSHNDISEVDADIFKEMPKLRKLNLSHNKLGKTNLPIKYGDFDRLSHMEEIDLSHNNILEIEAGALDGLSALRRLDLSHNRLGDGVGHGIKRGIFNGLSHVWKIDLSHNNISTVDEEAFSVLLSLKYLDLSHNRLGDGVGHGIKNGIFNGLSQVEKIDLSYNDIATVDEGCFSGLLSLEWLDLSHNRLGDGVGHSIKKGVFDGLSHVEEIDLSHNEISAVDEGAFSGLPILRRLDLSHNRLGQGFSPAFLSLPRGCVLCARAGQKACPADACPPPAAVDALWRALPGPGVLRLHGNPVCQAVASGAAAQERCVASGAAVEEGDGDCRVREGGTCSQHACRDGFLQAACVENEGDDDYEDEDDEDEDDEDEDDEDEDDEDEDDEDEDDEDEDDEDEDDEDAGEGAGDCAGDCAGEGEGVGEFVGEGTGGGVVLVGLAGMAAPLLIALLCGVTVAAIAFRLLSRRRAAAAAAAAASTAAAAAASTAAAAPLIDDDFDARGEATASDDADGPATSQPLLAMQPTTPRTLLKQEI